MFANECNDMTKHLVVRYNDKKQRACRNEGGTMNKRWLAGLMAVFMLAASSGCASRRTGDAPAEETTQAVTAQSGTTSPEETTVALASTPAPEAQGTPAEIVVSTPDPDAPKPEPAVQTQYPGVLRLMSMSRDEVAVLLGSTPDVYENRIQGFDVVKYADVGLVLEYDANHGALIRIQLADQVFDTSSGSYARFDVDGNGVREAVAAYEDAEGNGHVAVFDESAGTLLTDTVTRAFGGFSTLSFVTSNANGEERLIVLDTRAAWDCDVLSYSQNQLISVMPETGMGLEQPASVTFSSDMDAVDIRAEEQNLHFTCPLTTRISDILKDSPGSPVTRFDVRRKPVVGDEGMKVQVRTSLQVQLATLSGQVLPSGLLQDHSGKGASTVFVDSSDTGRFTDVGSIDQEYRYMGKGEWKLLNTSGSAKYTTGGEAEPIARNDLQISETWLLAPLYDFMEQFNLTGDEYSSLDLAAGVTVNVDGLLVDVRNETIAGLTLEPDCTLETTRGLKPGDSRERALALYGLPDKGYYEEDVWVWWYFRDWESDPLSVQPDDSFWVEFSGDRVHHVGMTGSIQP